MKTKYEQLVSLLEEMFQFDNEDLDFGIYRIMNQKRGEIRNFLHQDLLPQVKQAFEKYQTIDQVNIRKELEQLRKNLQDAGVEPETSPKYKALQEQLAQTIDLNALENEVYSHLVTFFSRYYDNGDFISKRKYKKDVYAIPYEGEEVKLYWANADQYYVKTSEYFRDYSFKLPSGKKVHFVLTEASTEQNNNKEQEGKERRFILCEESPLYEEQGELFIRFVYRENKEKQTTLNQQAVESILNLESYTDWIQELRTLAPTEKNKNRTILEKHLNDYTSKNTFDYFIHKDLGGFLRRELDFYIKNEIMHLDDLDTENEARIEQYLSKIKVVKSIGHKIIKFLEQIEKFQKKLWLKKKFVVETNYCVTLDRVPEELYPQIVQNHEQIEEWKNLFAIDEIKEDTNKPGYSESLKVEFLKANPYLVLDTKFFDQSFIDKLLMSLDDINEKLDGVLVHSENFQALHLLRESYKERVKSIYIDPPYNTSASEILYKNSFKHSSWLSLVENRLAIARDFLTRDGIICTTIDDYEFRNLWFVLANIFKMENHLGTVPIRNNPQGRSTVKGFAVNHEYALFFAAGEGVDSVGRLERSEQQNARYGEIDEEGRQYLWENFRKTGTDSNRADRPKQYYPIYYSNQGIRVPNMEWDATRKEWIILEQPKADEQVFWPINAIGVEKVWKWGHERVNSNPHHLKVDKGDNGELQVFRRNYLNTEGALPGTWWDKAKYSAGEYGTNLLTDMFGIGHKFPFPKSVFAVQDCIKVSGGGVNANILDFFAGSGTTAHAVINLNREDGGNRKYILVEMGTYFDTVLKPRIQKVIYSKDWKDGKPVSRQGSSHMFKYIRLESYEDTLNNLDINRTDEQQLALELMPTETREEYLLSYMLDIETEGSASLLNLEIFENPFNYKLKISNGTETTVKTVDVVETFNYLLGLTVRQIEVVQGFKVIKGELPTGERALIIWRNVKEKSNEDLEKFFAKSKYNTRDNEFDYIYVNGDNHLENIKLQENTWKVKLIEEEFKRLMFDVQDV
ncbi:site-specific DNA-methyltransferase [Brevibacillus sp. WF146]|uniref:site-specific DNA-methyltransferase n=1 Tax=Brevibacillus sp. WF146 TaxID=319501 RepID=UPI0007EC9FE8|nr:site-specific DNA-methyltransferase [Brevibacillus sp. WF146]UYZ13739.1 site-specific DNA-methyltransferase [Brevibacillus sp. WF146]